jgi:hypothetical protein
VVSGIDEVRPALEGLDLHSAFPERRHKGQRHGGFAHPACRPSNHESFDHLSH